MSSRWFWGWSHLQRRRTLTRYQSQWRRIGTLLKEDVDLQKEKKHVRSCTGSTQLRLWRPFFSLFYIFRLSFKQLLLVLMIHKGRRVWPFQCFIPNIQLSSLSTPIEGKPLREWAPQQHTEGLLTRCVMIQAHPGLNQRPGEPAESHYFKVWKTSHHRVTLALHKIKKDFSHSTDLDTQKISRMVLV